MYTCLSNSNQRIPQHLEKIKSQCDNKDKCTVGSCDSFWNDKTSCSSFDSKNLWIHYRCSNIQENMLWWIVKMLLWWCSRKLYYPGDGPMWVLLSVTCFYILWKGAKRKDSPETDKCKGDRGDIHETWVSHGYKSFLKCKDGCLEIEEVKLL